MKAQLAGFHLHRQRVKQHQDHEQQNEDRGGHRIPSRHGSQHSQKRPQRDDQADREAHGGPDKAVYAYAVEDLRWWEKQLGQSLEYGQFGENLTTEGINVNDALVGERWEIGSTILEVSEPRVPCWRLGVRMNDKMFPRLFAQALRPGPYLRIIVEGDVGAGDKIRIVNRPDHDLTIRDVFRIFTRDRDEVERLLGVPQLSESWRNWAENRLRIAGGQPEDSDSPGCC